MLKRRPCSLHIALVGILALALLVPAAGIAGNSNSGPNAAIAKKKCKKKKGGAAAAKKCKKKKGGQGGQAGGPAGEWNGTVSSNGAPLSFTVTTGAASVDNFAAVSLPVYCFGSGFTTKVFLIPSVPVAGGAFASVYQTTNSGGEVDGSFEVSGQLSNDTASGSLKYNRAGCASGPLTWTATRKQ